MLLIFLLNAPTHWFLGLSKLRYRVFVLGTIIGSIPNVAFATYFGEQALQLIQANAAAFWTAVGAVALTVFISRLALLAQRK